MNKFLSWLFWPRPKTIELSNFLLLAVIFSNLLPIIGILFFDWKVFPILVFYAIEGLFEAALSLVEIHQRETPRAKIPWYGILLLLIIIPMGILVPMITMIVVAASRIENAVESILNPYFFVSVVILIPSLMIPWLRRPKTHRPKRVNKTTDNEFSLLMFKIYLILGSTFAIVITNFYTAALIGVAVIKTFVDLRSFFRRQIVVESGKALYKAH